MHGKPNAAELVLGTAQLGLPYGVANRHGQPDGSHARLMLRAAVNAGVRWIDTAAAYGDAEARIGATLPNLGHVRVVTKLLPLDDLSPTASLASVRAAVDNSVRRSCQALKTERLDVLLLHRAHHLTYRDGAIWSRLKLLRTEGLIFDLGVSVYTPQEALMALADHDVSHIQLPFNLLDWRWHAHSVPNAIARRPDVTIHARSVYLQGLLASGMTARWPQVDGVNAPAISMKLAALARQLGRDSPADLCLAYVRAQKWIDGVVVGMERVQQLALNLALFKHAPLTPDEVKAVERALPRAPEQLLNPAQWPKAA